jgi:NADPH:quinone reductase-like Zn-dependent oxidoreductase
MHALMLEALHQPLAFQQTIVPIPGPGEELVALHAAALNHRDVYIQQGLYAGIQTPVILGSDGAGVCKGREVVICPGLYWGNDLRVQSKDFQVLGMPSNGTFAEFVCVPSKNVHPKPAHLDWEAAAALPLAGLTAWRLLFTRCRLQKGERVLITGIGGGVALLGLQLAHAAGAEVWVYSGSDEKIIRAAGLGAAGGANYREAGWDKQLKDKAKGFDLIMDSAGGDGFAALVGLCNPGARIGIYGGSLGKIGGLSPQIVFWKQINILGSSMGTNEEFADMLAFVARHRIVPVVDTSYELADGNAALERMRRGDQFGKIILQIARMK